MPALPTKRCWKSELAASLYGSLAWIVRQLPLGKAVRKTSQLRDVVIIRFHIPSPLRCEAGTAETVLRVSPHCFCSPDPSAFGRGGPPTPRASATRSPVFLYYETLTCRWLRQREQLSVLAGVSSYRGSPCSRRANVWSSQRWARHWAKGTAKSTWQDGDRHLDTSRRTDQHVWK